MNERAMKVALALNETSAWIARDMERLPKADRAAIGVVSALFAAASDLLIRLDDAGLFNEQ